MEFFALFDNYSFFNVCIIAITQYLITTIIFGVRLSTTENLSEPSLLSTLNSFSMFFILTLVLLFGFDFDLFDSLYFFNQNFQLIFFFVLLLVCLTSRDFLTTKTIAKFEYEILFLFVALSSICLCFADDFLTFYLAIELQSLSFYVFATFNRNSEFCTEAGLKYFVFGAVISCFLLLGFCFVYFAFGSTHFETLYSLIVIQNDAFLFIGIIFILIPLLFKIGSAPFHSWLCDVYDGSILTVTLLFASAPKIILFSIIVKLFYFLFSEFQTFSNVFFIYCSLGSIFVGSISALYQKRIKRLFAYSTITHTGFILLAILATSIESVKAIVFYIIIYSLLTVLLFSTLIYSVVTTNNYPKYLINWTSLCLKNYIYAITFTFILFSIAGVPPLAGFFSKFFVLFSVIAQEYYLIGVFVIVLSSIACFYYIRLIKIFFFSKTGKNDFWLSSTTTTNNEIIIGCLMLFNTCFFINPDLLSNFSTSVALSLF